MNFAFHLRELSRIVLDSLKHQIEFVEEPRAQAGLLVLVPYSRCLDVEFRLRLDDDSPSHQSGRLITQLTFDVLAGLFPGPTCVWIRFVCL